jgi:hypothetical protein
VAGSVDVRHDFRLKVEILLRPPAERDRHDVARPPRARGVVYDPGVASHTIAEILPAFMRMRERILDECYAVAAVVDVFDDLEAARKPPWITFMIGQCWS